MIRTVWLVSSKASCFSPLGTKLHTVKPEPPTKNRSSWDPT